MKARIDTIAKTVAIEEAVNIDELVKFIKALFPDNWKEWKVETNVKFDFVSPIIVERYPSHPWGPYWYAENPTYVGTGSGTFCLSVGGEVTV